MRDCCEEYEDMIAKLKAIRAVLTDEDAIRDIDTVISFLKEEWEVHVDRAGETAWEG